MARKVDPKLHQQRRQQILDVAAECFTEKGFHQTGMKEIYTKAKLSAGSVYHYFENKDAIIEAIASDFSVDIEQFIFTFRDNTDFIQGLIKAVRYRLKESQKYAKYGRLVIDIYAESFRNDKVKGTLKALDDELVTALKSRIERAISSYQISSYHDSKMLSYMLIAIIEGYEDRILQDPEIKLENLLLPFEDFIQKL